VTLRLSREHRETSQRISITHPKIWRMHHWRSAFHHRLLLRTRTRAISSCSYNSKSLTTVTILPQRYRMAEIQIQDSNGKAITVATNYSTAIDATTTTTSADVITNGKEQRQHAVLTLVMKIEYNGYCYAGFQRQTATNTTANINSSKENNNTSSKPAKRKRTTCDSPTPSSTNLSTAFPNTIQHQLEMAIQKYTNLSLSTLRLRGAGRTDAGVHATGQMVAFDIPIRLLGVGFEEEEGESITETLSEHCFQHLREAYLILMRHLYSLTNNNPNDEGTNDPTRGRPNLASDQWQIRRAITTRLPSDIAIRYVKMYTANEFKPFEPRKDVKCKTYIYKLRFRKLSYIMMEPHPIIHPICNSGPHLLRRINDQNTIWLCPWALDPELLRKSSLALVGKHDFVNFVHKEERKKRRNNSKAVVAAGDGVSLPSPPVHEIDLFDFNVAFTQSEGDKTVHDEGNVVGMTALPPVMDATFTLRAKGFQRSMVRNLVGFVVDVARGIRSLEDIPVLLLEEVEERLTHDEGDTVNNSNNKYLSLGNSSSMVNSAPACGLCLAEVEYDHDNFV